MTGLDRRADNYTGIKLRETGSYHRNHTLYGNPCSRNRACYFLSASAKTLLSVVV